MKIPFIKIEGLGNDYIYIDASRNRQLDYPGLAKAISDRRHGVGADGLIVMKNLGPNSASMTIFNRDGSQAEFCGNGLRGTALYLKSVHKAKGKRFSITTRRDKYVVEFISVDGDSAIVGTDMGSPSFDPGKIGFKGKNCLSVPIKSGGKRRFIFCVAMPNPHAVIFVDNFEFDWQREGATLEKSSIFRNGSNIMFTKVDSTNRITVMPWERGSGATSACGSGAAAAAVVSNLLEYTRGTVRATMPGGSLLIRWDIEQNKVFQEGPTRIAFSGIYNH